MDSSIPGSESIEDLTVRIFDPEKTKYFDPFGNRASGRYPKDMPMTGTRFDVLYPDMVDIDDNPLTMDNIYQGERSLAGLLDMPVKDLLVYGGLAYLGYRLWKSKRK